MIIQKDLPKVPERRCKEKTWTQTTIDPGLVEIYVEMRIKEVWEKFLLLFCFPCVVR